MCDYSLYAIPNRLAIEGEELVVHKFPTGSLGLASVADVRESDCRQLEAHRRRSFWQTVKSIFDAPHDSKPIPAVCVPPGAYLILKDIPLDMQQQYGVEPEEGVVFVQISVTANTYRDGLRFHNGGQIRLQELRQGQPLEVLSLVGTHIARHDEVEVEVEVEAQR